MGKNIIFATSFFLVAAQLAPLEAWSPVSVRKNDSTTTTALFAKEQPPKRRFSQARTQTTAYRSDSKIGSIHKERLKTAGRPGTKRFVDPCKVFVGVRLKNNTIFYTIPNIYWRFKSKRSWNCCFIR